MADSFRPGDVKVHSLALWSNDRARSVTNMSGLVKNIKIYESIMDPLMTAVITIADGVGLRQSFPLIGEEYFELDLETPGMDEIFTYRFDVLSIGDIKEVHEDKSVVYNLYCSSTEIKKNTRIIHELMNDTAPVDAVQKIFKDYLGSDKELFTGEGVYAKVDFDLNRMRPLEAIDKIRLLTRNIQEQSSAFCFFETKHGFNFMSVEQMFGMGKTKIGDKVFFYDAAQGRSIYENNFRNIVGMSRLSDASPTRGAMGGQLNAKMKTFDIITGEITERQYKDSESGAGFIYADDDASSLRSSSGQVEDGAEPAQYLMNVTDSSKADPSIQEVVLERSSYVNKIIQQLYKIEIHGDLAISAGDVIEVNVPGASGLTDKSDDGTDQRFSGNFMVSRLVNNITFLGPRPVHSITCELIKGNIR